MYGEEFPEPIFPGKITSGDLKITWLEHSERGLLPPLPPPVEAGSFDEEDLPPEMDPALAGLFDVDFGLV